MKFILLLFIFVGSVLTQEKKEAEVKSDHKFGLAFEDFKHYYDRKREFEPWEMKFANRILIKNSNTLDSVYLDSRPYVLSYSLNYVFKNSRGIMFKDIYFEDSIESFNLHSRLNQDVKVFKSETKYNFNDKTINFYEIFRIRSFELLPLIGLRYKENSARVYNQSFYNSDFTKSYVKTDALTQNVGIRLSYITESSKDPNVKFNFILEQQYFYGTGDIFYNSFSIDNTNRFNFIGSVGDDTLHQSGTNTRGMFRIDSSKSSNGFIVDIVIFNSNITQNKFQFSPTFYSSFNQDIPTLVELYTIYRTANNDLGIMNYGLSLNIGINTF